MRFNRKEKINYFDLIACRTCKCLMYQPFKIVKTYTSYNLHITPNQPYCGKCAPIYDEVFDNGGIFKYRTLVYTDKNGVPIIKENIREHIV